MSNPRNSRQFQVHFQLLEPVCSKVTQAYTYKEWMENKCFPGVYASLHYKGERLVSVGIILNAETQRAVTSATVNNGAHASCASILFSYDWLVSSPCRPFKPNTQTLLKYDAEK